MTNEAITLFYKDASSDKEYHAQLEASGQAYTVNFQYGRRGGTLATGTKTSSPVEYTKAKKIYDKLVQEKTSKGYTPSSTGQAFAMTAVAQAFTGILPQLLNPIDDAAVASYIKDDAYIAQEKHDGHRRMMESIKNTIQSINRKGLSVGLPSETEQALQVLNAEGDWRVDGELMGSTYAIFDVLLWKGKDVRDQSVDQRLAILDKIAKLLKTETLAYVTYTAKTTKEKQDLFDTMKINKHEGLVFKLRTSTYVAGRPNSGGNQVKFKFWHTATCIVAGMSKSGKRSVELELFDTELGTRRGCGKVTISVNFDVPNVGDLVEIRYLYAYKGAALAQPQYLGVRDDIDVSACTTDQLYYKRDTDEDE